MGRICEIMITVIFCDDELTVIQRYIKLFDNIKKKINEQICIEIYTSGEQVLFHISERPEAVAVLFLDIQMTGLDGIATAKTLRKMGCFAEIIFLSAYKQYVFESFEVHPFHYLLKDIIKPNYFETVFFKALEKYKQRRDHFYSFRTSDSFVHLDIAHILFIEVYQKMITIHCQDQVYRFRGTISKLCNEFIPHGFLKLSQSCLINYDYLDFIKEGTAYLSTGEALPISRRYRKDVNTEINSRVLSNYSSLYNI